MRIIISPAKKMNVDTDTLEFRNIPAYFNEASCLMKYMRSLSYEEAKAIWKCNDKLARLNYERFQHMDLTQGLTPAILSYEGIQYQYMAPAVFEEKSLEYVEEHLRILSGFYGILRPFDGVTPYRLEMQAKVSFDPQAFSEKDYFETFSSDKISAAKDGNAPSGKVTTLYQFWRDKIARQLLKETDCIVNLASKEYSKSVTPYLSPDCQMITCVFGEWLDGKVKEKGTLAKMARGEMVRFMAEHQIQDPREIQSFHRLNYQFYSQLSDESTYVFLKG